MRATLSSCSTSAERRSMPASRSSLACLKASKPCRNSSNACLISWVWPCVHGLGFQFHSLLLNECECACSPPARNDCARSLALARADGRDRRTREQREGHDRNLPKLDFQKRARVARSRPRLARTVRKPIDRPFSAPSRSSARDIARLFHIADQAAAHIQPACCPPRSPPTPRWGHGRNAGTACAPGRRRARRRLAAKAPGATLSPAPSAHIEQRGIAFELVGPQRRQPARKGLRASGRRA